MTESAKKAIEEKAREWATHHSSAPDKETPDWIEIDFKGGAEFDYSDKKAGNFYAYNTIF